MITQREPNVQNVGPGKTAICMIPLGGTIDKFMFELGGGLLTSHITATRVKINSKDIAVGSGADWVNRQRHKSVYIDAANDNFTMDWTEPNARGGIIPQLAATIPASVEAGVKDIRIELDIDAAAPAPSTIQLTTQRRAPSLNPNVKKFFELVHPNLVVGWNDIFLPAGGIAGSVLQRLYIAHDAAEVDEVELRVGSNVPIWSTTANLLEFMSKENGLTPQAGLSVIDFIMDGNLSNSLPTINTPQVHLRIKANATGPLKTIMEIIDPVNRL